MRGLLVQNKLRYGVFRETADIGMDEIGQGSTTDEIGGHIAAGSAQPTVCVLANGVAKGGGQQLESAQNDEV